MKIKCCCSNPACSQDRKASPIESANTFILPKPEKKITYVEVDCDKNNNDREPSQKIF